MLITRIVVRSKRMFTWRYVGADWRIRPALGSSWLGFPFDNVRNAYMKSNSE
jgi:hypothetical protein